MSHHRKRRRESLEAEAQRRRLVVCNEDGLRPGYVICTHIIDGIRKAATIEAPRPGALGKLVCSIPFHRADELALICDVCAFEHRHTEIVPAMELPDETVTQKKTPDR